MESDRRFAEFLQIPKSATSFAEVGQWLTDVLAPRLLHGCELKVAGQPHRLAEIEFYLHAPGRHEDPFTHADPIQLTTGQWYLHRTGKGFRGGTYKGIDLTFGGDVHGGILLRSLECPDGRLVEGPSLCVDYLLQACMYTQVAELDRVIGGVPAWSENPVQLCWREPPGDGAHVRSARVGLTLKRAAEHPRMRALIFQPYRFFIRPRDIRKGRNYLILQLHREGVPAAVIAAQTGSPLRSVQRQIDGYTRGLSGGHDASLSAFQNRALSPSLLAQLCGAWSAHYG